jgi:hypothetical protein
MGLLREVDGEGTSLLEPEHLIGRAQGCSLRIGRPYVSAQHAHLRWAQTHWELKDLGSRNGTFLDGERIQVGADVALKEGARLGFGKMERAWVLADDSAPKTMVVPLDGREPRIIEGDILVLPSEEDPRLTIYMGDGGWNLEQPDESTTPICNAQLFELDGTHWRFACPDTVWRTALASAPGPMDLRSAHLVFSVSRDEEFVDLHAKFGGTEIALGARAFNYLLLTLARRRLADAKEGTSEAASGWIYQEDLGRDPTMAPPQLNIDVFRIRRHFAAAGIAGAAGIIERRPRTRQLRLGVAHIDIRTI